MTEPAAPAAETAPAVVEPTPTEPPEGQSVDTLPEWARGAITKANKEAAKYRTELAELRPLAEQGRELAEGAQRMEEAQKSETQKLTEQLAAARQQHDSLTADALRYRVALEHGITDPGDLAMVRGGTEEELTAAAQWIKQKNDAAASVQSAPTAPPAAKSQQAFPGATPTVAPTVTDDAYPSSWLSPTQAARIAGASTTP